MTWLHYPARAVRELTAARGAPAWRLSTENSRLATPLLATLAACTLAFSKLAEEMASGELASIDGSVAVWLHSHATGFATLLLGSVTRLGGTEVLLVVTLLAVLAMLARRRLAPAALMAAALGGGEALNSALKAAFERPRPSFSDPLATAAGFSFPSGHAMVSLTVYGALAFVTATSVALTPSTAAGADLPQSSWCSPSASAASTSAFTTPRTSSPPTAPGSPG